MDIDNVKHYNKFNISLLSNNELLEFSNIHKKMIPKRTKKMSTNVIRKNNSSFLNYKFINFNFLKYKFFNNKFLLKINKENKNDETLNLISKKLNIDLVKPILDKSLNILKDNQILNYDQNQFCIEFHQRNCGFEKNKYQWSTWHYDDDGPFNFKVHTVIFYLRKDKTVKGGNLEYKLNKKIELHHVKSGDIVQFSGKVYHKPQPTYGFGCRDIIVVFIKRTN